MSIWLDLLTRFVAPFLTAFVFCLYIWLYNRGRWSKPQKRANYHSENAIQLESLGELEKAIKEYEAALQIWEEEGNREKIGIICKSLGEICKKKQDWDRSIDYFARCLAIWQAMKSEYSVNELYRELGIIYYNKGELEEAQKNCEVCLKLEERVVDNPNLATTYNYLALISKRKGLYDQSIAHYEKSLRILDSLNDIRGAASVYYNIGNVYAEKGDNDRSKIYYQHSINRFEKIGDDIVEMIKEKMNRSLRNLQRHETDSLYLDRKAEADNFDVFLCHNNIDKPTVREIGLELKKRGILPWLDEWEMRPGLPWQKTLEEQVEKIKSVAVFVGKEGFGPWQDIEQSAFLREFVKRRCPVIPVILPDCKETPKLPIILEGMHWVDFRKKDQDAIEQLIWGITGKRRIV